MDGDENLRVSCIYSGPAGQMFIISRVSEWHWTDISPRWIRANIKTDWKSNLHEAYIRHPVKTMMTSSYGNISALLALCVGNPPVTGGFPLAKASDAELWCFLWSASEQTVEQTIRTGNWRRHRAHYNVTVIQYQADYLDYYITRHLGPFY